MANKTLILTVGLPRSGKSTWSQSTGYPVVNRDSIRLALHGQAYVQESEDMISAIEKYMVKSLFLAGHDIVIIDAMNLKSHYIDRWLSLTLYFDLKIKLKVFSVSADICIARARADRREELIPIIEKYRDSAFSVDDYDGAYEIIKEDSRKTVAIDFDGPLHAYSLGRGDGSIYDRPTLNAVEAVERLRLDFNVVVFTSRTDTTKIVEWISQHFDGWRPVVTNRKPPAIFYIDDRAIRFESWPDVIADMANYIRIEKP